MTEEQKPQPVAQQNEPLASSEHLTLYKFNPDIQEHSDILYRLWNSPHFIELEGKTAVDSPEKAKSVIQNRFIAEYNRNGYGAYLVVIKKLDSQDTSPIQFIGTVGLTKGDSPTSFSAPDIGFALLPEYLGRGYATEAGKLILEYAERTFDLKNALGLCNPKNKASRAVLERIGFTFRGVHELKCFGGVQGCVYTLPHMSEDLSVYGI
jgi:RimJ/RimL family protein N-acetyltransferase